MAHVLVLDNDPSIRDVVRDILVDAGHTVDVGGNIPDDVQPTLEYLRTHAERMVVLFDVGPHDAERVGFLQSVTAAPDAPLLLRHAYVCLTTVPAHLPPDLLALFRRHGVAVLPKPFEMDALLAAVAEAERRLTTAG